jgi:TonB family protein
VPKSDAQSGDIFDQFDGTSTATTPVPASTATESPRSDSTQQQTIGKPKIVHAPHPSYPSKADKMHVTGSGRFKITFDHRGNTKSVEIVKSTGDQTLDSNTIKTLKLWRAAPGNPSYVIVPVDYRQRPQSRPKPQAQANRPRQNQSPTYYRQPPVINPPNNYGQPPRQLPASTSLIASLTGRLTPRIAQLQRRFRL